MYKCRYADCIVPQPPISPALNTPVTRRSLDYFNWTDLAVWATAQPGWGGYSENASDTGLGVLPLDGDQVKIPRGVYIVVNCPLPQLKLLQIEGILEFDNTLDHRLVADMILINGGQLIIGWENNPILKNVEIEITGEKNSLQFTLPDQNQRPFGGKGIGVYGGLDLHGRPRQPVWTRLAATALVGDDVIILEKPVDWEIG